MFTVPATETDPRLTAERRAIARVSFIPHVIAYGIVNAGLLAFNLATTGSPHFLWLVGSFLGWGCGLVGHGWAAYGPAESRTTPPSNPSPSL